MMAGPSSPTPIRCSGRRTRSSATAACDNRGLERGIGEAGDEEDLDRLGCGRPSDDGDGAGGAIDYGLRGEDATAARGDRRGPPRHSARTEGGDRLAERDGALTIAAPAHIRILWRRDDQSGLRE